MPSKPLPPAPSDLPLWNRERPKSYRMKVDRVFPPEFVAAWPQAVTAGRF